MRIPLVTALLIGLPGANALADTPPPQEAKPLSELLQSIEKSADFRYIDEVDWDDGAYEVEYYTSGRKEEDLHRPCKRQSAVTTDCFSSEVLESTSVGSLSGSADEPTLDAFGRALTIARR